jgi:hypothetical protein
MARVRTMLAAACALAVRTPPAMAAGVTSQLWEINDVVVVLGAWEATQNA